ncbi:MAG: response regulator [Chitinophagaceae bacterium]
MSKSRLIIYVDDDEDDRELFRDSFGEIDGYQLVILNSGRDFFEYMRTNNDPVGLVVLDINMPEISGLQILEDLKSSFSYRSIPVVMFSTARNFVQTKFITDLGSDLIVKPSSFDEMKNVMQKLIAHAK